MNHRIYRDCVYIHNGLIYTIRRVKILIFKGLAEVINKLIFNNLHNPTPKNILIQSLTLYAQNNCSIWCWWKTVEVYKLYIKYVVCSPFLALSV